MELVHVFVWQVSKEILTTVIVVVEGNVKLTTTATWLWLACHLSVLILVQEPAAHLRNAGFKIIYPHAVVQKALLVIHFSSVEKHQLHVSITEEDSVG